MYIFPCKRIRYIKPIAINTHIDCLNNSKCSVRYIFKATKQGALKVTLYHFLLSTWVWTNAFGMLQVATSQPSCALITAVKRVPSVLTVGLITSSCSIYAHCVLPFAQCQDIIVLSLFSVKNRSDSIALCLSDLLSERL